MEPLASFQGKVDWFSNPTYNKYAEWTWQLSRHNEWKILAHMYRKTGKEKYAKTCADLFESWVRQAVRPEDTEGFQTLCWRTIECGIRMGANWPYVLHSFYTSEAFTDDILIDWYKSVYEHADSPEGSSYEWKLADYGDEWFGSYQHSL